jgi:3-hydroxybutyryl-CoA dehydrogenase
LRDVPGFLGNRMQHALWREAMSLVQQGIATPEGIDEVVKSGFGLRMPFLGPLETADLAGLDLSLDVHEDLFPHLENAVKPLTVLTEKVEQGVLGVKTGRGFHDWPKQKLERVIKERDRFLLRISQLSSET